MGTRSARSVWTGGAQSVCRPPERGRSCLAVGVARGVRRMQLSWSDPRLSVASDSRRTARYRLLQSWYREQVLNARYGDFCGGGGGTRRPLGSLLDIED